MNISFLVCQSGLTQRGRIITVRSRRLVKVLLIEDDAAVAQFVPKSSSEQGTSVIFQAMVQRGY
jgi:hypothetical protein